MNTLPPAAVHDTIQTTAIIQINHISLLAMLSIFLVHHSLCLPIYLVPQDAIKMLLRTVETKFFTCHMSSWHKSNKIKPMNVNSSAI